MGEHLGRPEMQVFFEQLVKRIDTITIVEDLMHPPNHGLFCKKIEKIDIKVIENLIFSISRF